MHSDYLVHDGLEVHIRRWEPTLSTGTKHKKTAVCWHGLARNGADFEFLAGQLTERGWRVLAPDTPGRGLSQWASEPARQYSYQAYIDLAQTLLEHYDCQQVDWIGTSMGGLLGIFLAGALAPERIRSLVINDIAPEVPHAALMRIVKYVSHQPRFSRFSELLAYLRQLYLPMGERDEQGWQKLAEHTSRREAGGQFTLHYDPAILAGADPEQSSPLPDLWQAFSAVRCPLQLLHGTQSDVLTDALAERMCQEKPEMPYHRFDDCGHAVGLHQAQHTAPVLEFLAKLG